MSMNFRQIYESQVQTFTSLPVESQLTLSFLAILYLSFVIISTTIMMSSLVEKGFFKESRAKVLASMLFYCTHIICLTAALLTVNLAQHSDMFFDFMFYGIVSNLFFYLTTFLKSPNGNEEQNA